MVKVVGCLLAITLCVLAQSRRQGEIFPARAVIRLENLRGNLVVELSNTVTVEVRAVREGVGGVSSSELRVSQTDKELSISTRPEREKIDLFVRAPRGTQLRLLSDVGNIRVDGVSAEVFARSRVGDIELVLVPDLDADVALSGSNVVAAQALVSLGLRSARAVYGQLGRGGVIVTAHSDAGKVKLSLGESPAGVADVANVGSEPAGGGLSGVHEADASEARSSSGQDTSAGVSSKRERPVLRRAEEKVADMRTTSSSDDDDLGDNVLRIESQLVTLNASVVDAAGKAVVDLTKDDFAVYEDGIKQEVVHFQSVNVPFNLVLLIDLSGSVKDKLRLIRRSAWRFVQSARPEDKIAIVTFTSSTRLVCTFTNDRELLRQKIENIREPEGGTNFYDALHDTLRWVVNKKRGERNAIVVMTDGVDNALPGVPGSGSQVSFIELYNLVQESDTIIFPVYLHTEQEAIEDWGLNLSQAYQIARKQLNQLAETTGGSIYYANEISDLEGCYEQVASQLRTIYTLGYYPSNSERDGSYRKIRVKVGRAGLQVKSRRGYYAHRS
ncbi:MAG: VWA domain-containing protein [Acidobacteriota bacterium]|nr:VWA domain-containing protein [Blastocatellia bacterium]MDW8413005.1 VWA domain-containing protein [Acidobacteriota bacterium]